MPHIECPITKVNLWESEAVYWPEKGLGVKPHLIQDEMYEGAKGENKQPQFSPTSIKVESRKADNDKKQERVAKYPAITENIAK